MSDDYEEILCQIEHHRAEIAALEARLGQPATAQWPPPGFYLTFYVLAGTMLGIFAGITSFLFEVIASLLVNQDPLRFLRVYGTVFLGARALTTNELNFFMLVTVVHFSLAAIAGAVFHIAVNRVVPDRPLAQIACGCGYGILLWVVNFHGVLVWLQPRLVGEPYVLELMPAWAAALTHLIYGATLGLLQPLGRVVSHRPPPS